MADFKENSPIAELEEPQFRMPARDPSLDDFEKLENFIIQDKNIVAAEAGAEISRDLLADNEFLLGSDAGGIDNVPAAAKAVVNNKIDTDNNHQNLLGDFNSNKGSDDAPPSYEQSSADLLLGDTFSHESSHLPRYTQEAYERPSSVERLLQFEAPVEPPSPKDESPSINEKLVHPPSDSGYVPSPAEEIAEIKEIIPPREQEKPSGLKITPFVDSVDDLLTSEKLDTFVEKVAAPREESPPKKSTPVNRKSPNMSTEVSSSKPATAKGCPWSPSALFDKNRLHPLVTSLVYWQDPKKSGIVFGVSLLFLISLRYFSFISVISYLALAIISITLSFRIYKNVLQAVQKSGEGHPFKEVLEVDISIPQEKVHETADVLVSHAVSTVIRLRSMFLVEDLVDSIKLGIVLWCLTYLGAWFNGLTLITLGFIAIFSLPKVYETNQAQIDQYLNLVSTQISGVVNTIKSKIPFGQKEKAQ